MVKKDLPIFFDGHGGNIDVLNCHCIEFYYVMKSKGDTILSSNSINSIRAVEHMKWIPIEETGQYNIKPSFLMDRLTEIVNSDKVLHIVSDIDKN